MPPNHMLAKDDVQLMLQFQSERCQGALAELFRRNKKPLLRFLRRLSGNLATAEDVSQQTWLKVLDVAQQGLYSAESSVAYRTWLCTIARNHFIDEYRRQKIATRAVSLPDDCTGLRLDDTIYKGERANHLRAALQALPFEQRDVVVLWAQGVAIEAIAALTAAPRDTVLSRKKYAIAKLRSMLSTALSESA